MSIHDRMCVFRGSPGLVRRGDRPGRLRGRHRAARPARPREIPWMLEQTSCQSRPSARVAPDPRSGREAGGPGGSNSGRRSRPRSNGSRRDRSSGSHWPEKVVSILTETDILGPLAGAGELLSLWRMGCFVVLGQGHRRDIRESRATSLRQSRKLRSMSLITGSSFPTGVHRVCHSRGVLGHA
jgi:hypothetical protein